jgi:hypothetical protein
VKQRKQEGEQRAGGQDDTGLIATTLPPIPTIITRNAARVARSGLPPSPAWDMVEPYGVDQVAEGMLPCGPRVVV